MVFRKFFSVQLSSHVENNAQQLGSLDFRAGSESQLAHNHHTTILIFMNALCTCTPYLLFHVKLDKRLVSTVECH